VKNIGKPCAGKPHARFDEGWLARHLAGPAAYSTRVKAGTVWVNAYYGIGLWGMPYGGYKQSGVGRELGHEGLKEYMETKSIHIQTQRPCSVAGQVDHRAAFRWIRPRVFSA